MTFGLTDVDVEYTEADFQNLTTYKLFQQHVRPMLGKENPKVNNTKSAWNFKCTVIFFFFGQNVFLQFLGAYLYRIGSNV